MTQSLLTFQPWVTAKKCLHPVWFPVWPSALLLAEYLYQVMKFNNCSIPEEVNKRNGRRHAATSLNLLLLRACTWFASIPSTPGTPTETTRICATTKIWTCCPGSRSSSERLVIRSARARLPVTWRWPLSSSLHSKFDLYTKTTEMPDVEGLKPYYQSLIDKYCPGVLKWWNPDDSDDPQLKSAHLLSSFNLSKKICALRVKNTNAFSPILFWCCKKKKQQPQNNPHISVCLFLYYISMLTLVWLMWMFDWRRDVSRSSKSKIREWSVSHSRLSGFCAPSKWELVLMQQDVTNKSEWKECKGRRDRAVRKRKRKGFSHIYVCTGACTHTCTHTAVLFGSVAWRQQVRTVWILLQLLFILLFLLLLFKRVSLSYSSTIIFVILQLLIFTVISIFLLLLLFLGCLLLRPLVGIGAAVGLLLRATVGRRAPFFALQQLQQTDGGAAADDGPD